jgi:predicted  nucleic acid-binding Zn-ribbon protein
VSQTRREEPHRPPDPERVSLWVGAPVPKYVIGRGFSEVHREWGLGYDERSRRWVHLIRDEHGEVQGYTARTTWKKDHCFRCGEMIVKDGKRLHKCPGCGMGHMKYRHHPGPWRRDNLFGIERHVEGEPIVITEGTTDALNLWRHGVRHPVAILGASLSAGQAQLIARRTSTVFVAGDGDMAGRALNAEVDRVLSALGVSVTPVHVADGSDPGSMRASEVADLFRDCTA